MKTDQIQSRLLKLAGAFLVMYALVLTLSPAVRERTWLVEYRWTHWIGLAVWIAAFTLADRQIRRSLPDRDPYLLPLAGLLSGWGLLTIWRLVPGFGLRQTIWLTISVTVLIGGLRLQTVLETLRRYKYLWLTGGLILTALTLIFGTNPAGTGPRLWLGCCGVYLQPSEPLKLFLVVYLAAYLADRLPLRQHIFPLIFPTLFVTGMALLLLVVQRDLGTASIFILLYTIVLYLATGRRRVLLVSAGALILAGGLGYFAIGIIRERLDVWLNPWNDPSGSAYQIVQSLLAFANGGLLGRGPGLGSPGLVPISHSDFIFTAIGEENGLMGTVALLGILGFLILRGMRAAMIATNRFHRLLAAGLTTYVGLQSILIVGGNLRLLPLTGVTLPFVSYGGSSLLTSFVALLILLQIGGQPETEPAPIPRPLPYYVTSGLLLLGLLSAALLNGWWAIVRGPDLLTRTDNPRRAIADRYVPRGNLLDRTNTPINATQGEIGNYKRLYLYPQLAPVVGYTHPTYGQAGLEASLDPYLRGMQGNPASLVWWNELVYGQPPAGLDVRLSLDLPIQSQADKLVGKRTGALVLVNASNGEIIAMVSHPTFDPNHLDAQAENLAQDENSPLLNRAAQGRYSPGTALGAFLLAASDQSGSLPELPPDSSLTTAGRTYNCMSPDEPADWPTAIADGCPGPLYLLGGRLGEDKLLILFDTLGFYNAPDIRLQTAPAAPRQIEVTPAQAAIGLGDLTVSPLQMALAAAALSNNGERPSPQLATAVDTPQQGWVILPPTGKEKPAAFTEEAASAASQSLMVPNKLYWQSLGQTHNGENVLTWYLAGSLPGWQGTPLALALVLEEDNPADAIRIGQSVLDTALQP